MIPNVRDVHKGNSRVLEYAEAMKASVTMGTRRKCMIKKSAELLWNLRVVFRDEECFVHILYHTHPKSIDVTNSVALRISASILLRLPCTSYQKPSQRMSGQVNTKG